MSAIDPRPVHLQPAMLGVVLVGGAVGTAARAALSLVIPDVGGLPVAILVINVVGSFLLGVLLEALTRRGADVGRRRTVRLLLGTGFCGGFTTYSTLAVGAAELLRVGATGLGVAYAVGSVLLGALAAWVGTLVGSRR
ncbi:fluoride efflux transporter FluC [uncultured Amnibacterium sp.]|uniref:fluoride efflux transporter FluC n=1 Tax=uncultured Amnibacterium sp. TaxID=1631851 RepID=UPI0035CB8D96